jgi:hypothetical protein
MKYAILNSSILAMLIQTLGGLIRTLTFERADNHNNVSWKYP